MGAVSDRVYSSRSLGVRGRYPFLMRRVEIAHNSLKQQDRRESVMNARPEQIRVVVLIQRKKNVECKDYCDGGRSNYGKEPEHPFS